MKTIRNSIFNREKMLAIFGWNFEFEERCKGVLCVDLGESFPTNIYLQKSASIQPRTSSFKFYSILFNIIQSCPYLLSSNFRPDPPSFTPDAALPIEVEENLVGPVFSIDRLLVMSPAGLAIPATYSFNRCGAEIDLHHCNLEPKIITEYCSRTAIATTSQRSLLPI